MNRARTIAAVRLLRALGMRSRRRSRLPRQQQPDTIRLDYYRAIQAAVCEPARRAFDREAPELLRLLEDWRRGRRIDVAEDDRAKVLLDRAAERLAHETTHTELHRIAERFGKRTSDFQRQQLDRQVRQAMGVPLSSVERPIVEKLDGFARENVALIKTIPERYFDSLRQRVREAFERGTHPQALAQEFADTYETSLSNARRIARDQVGRLSGQLNEERQKSMGVTSATWRTSRDNRVRDEHSILEGVVFKWSDPPLDRKSGERITPGSQIQCRCYAEPSFAEIIEGVESTSEVRNLRPV